MLCYLFFVFHFPISTVHHELFPRKSKSDCIYVKVPLKTKHLMEWGMLNMCIFPSIEEITLFCYSPGLLSVTTPLEKSRKIKPIYNFFYARTTNLSYTICCYIMAVKCFLADTSDYCFPIRPLYLLSVSVDFFLKYQALSYFQFMTSNPLILSKKGTNISYTLHLSCLTYMFILIQIPDGFTTKRTRWGSTLFHRWHFLIPR